MYSNSNGIHLLNSKQPSPKCLQDQGGLYSGPQKRDSMLKWIHADLEGGLNGQAEILERVQGEGSA